MTRFALEVVDKDLVFGRGIWFQCSYVYYYCDACCDQVSHALIYISEQYALPLNALETVEA